MRATAQILLRLTIFRPPTKPPSFAAPTRSRLCGIAHSELVRTTAPAHHERKISFLESDVVHRARTGRRRALVGHAAHGHLAVSGPPRNDLEAVHEAALGRLRHRDLDDLAGGALDELRRRAAKRDLAAIEQREIGAPRAE